MTVPPLFDWIRETAGCRPAVPSHRPVPRHLLEPEAWTALIGALGSTDWELFGLWADGDVLHVALRDPGPGTFAVLTRDCPDKSYPSLGHVRPGAIRLERAVADLHALISSDGPDRRPWLDHGHWEH